MEKTENKKISAESILSSLWRILLGAIIAILVLVAGTLAYDKFVKKSPIPSIFGKSLLIIATPSMTGSIEAGDAIIIKKSDDYAVGDVITYFPADEATSVTHRIVRIEGDKYYAKGDANNSEDPDPIVISQIAGKMVGRIPKIGIVIEWLRTWQGIAFMLAVGAVIVALVMVAGKPDEEYAEANAENSEANAENSEAGGEAAEAYSGIAVKNAETATPHDEAETREDESAAEKDVDR